MTNLSQDGAYVLPFEQLRMTDVEVVGGKNASLGEMISQLDGAGVRRTIARLGAARARGRAGDEALPRAAGQAGRIDG